MTFGRSDAQWQAMTPAQLHLLSSSHNRAHRGGRGRSSGPAHATPSRGSTSDLFALSAMQRV